MPEQEQQAAEEPQRAPTVPVPADGRMVDEPFMAPADVAAQWDHRVWRRA